MDTADLEQLNAAVEHLLSAEEFAGVVDQLKARLPIRLPDAIESCWVFHLRGGVPSGSHRHPNSVQHMASVSGVANAKVGRISTRTVEFSSDVATQDKWLVIPIDVCHEFTPLDGDMTVVSFHTVGVDELEEVSCDTGESRFYEAG
jgi:hypothetical protein